MADLGREAYMGGDDSFGDVAILLDADSPTEVLQQAATLRGPGGGAQRAARAAGARRGPGGPVDLAARTAVAERDRAARAADETAAAAAAQLSAAQGTYDACSPRRPPSTAQLREAEIRLLAGAGRGRRRGQWASQQAAKETAGLLIAAGGAVAPANGRVTSCYGARWGTLHAGVDIAAPIGTPVFTPEDGIVLDAGPASGFGRPSTSSTGTGPSPSTAT